MSMTSHYKQHENHPTAPAVQSVLTLRPRRNPWKGLGCVFQAIVGGAHLSMAGILTNTAKNNHLTLHKVLTNPSSIAAKHSNLTQNETLQESKSPLAVKFPPKEEKVITERIHRYLKDQMQHHQNEIEEEDEEEDPWSEEDEEIEEEEEEDHGEEIFVSEEEEENGFHHESDIDEYDEKEEDEEEVDELEEEHHVEEEYELENTHEEQEAEEHEGNFVFLNSLKYAVELLWVDNETGEKHPALLDGEHIILPNKKVDISAIHGHVFHAYPAGNTAGVPIKTFQVDEQSFGLELDMEL